MTLRESPNTYVEDVRQNFSAALEEPVTPATVKGELTGGITLLVKGKLYAVVVVSYVQDKATFPPIRP